MQGILHINQIQVCCNVMIILVKHRWLDVWRMRENVKEFFVLVKSCLLLMATILLCCKANLWMCMGKCVQTQIRAYACYTSVWQWVSHCYFIPSNWQRVWERTSLWYFPRTQFKMITCAALNNHMTCWVSTTKEIARKSPDASPQ